MWQASSMISVFLRIKAEEMLTREDCIKHSVIGYEMIRPNSIFTRILRLFILTTMNGMMDQGIRKTSGGGNSS